MSFINHLIASSIHLFPKWLVKPFASPYVAGDTFEIAIPKIRALNTNGYKVTIDILGEHVKDSEQARHITKEYCSLFNIISKENLDCNISIKPTHIGLDVSLAESMANIHHIINAAKSNQNFLRLDMENSPFTDATFELYDHCKTIHPKVGVVLQSYLHRSMNDVNQRISPQFNARICKGIYTEDPSIAYQSNEDIHKNYVALVQSILTQGGYCAIATHDLTLIDELETWIVQNNVPNDRFEFQVLYGVPMQGRLELLLAKGYTVRIYVPFGSAWFDYSLRRLKENPNIVGYVIKNIFKQK